MHGAHPPSALSLIALVLATACGGERRVEDSRPGFEGSETEIGQNGPRLLVVNKSSNTVSVVDPDAAEVLLTLETGFAPHEIAASRDGRFAYVTNYGTGTQPGSTITVLDLQGGAVLGALSVAPHTRPHGIAIAADGTLWVTTEGSAHVVQLDPASGQILEAIETGQSVTHMVAVADSIGKVVTANIGSGTATIVNPGKVTEVMQVVTGDGAEGLAVHPDGRRAYVTNRTAGTLVEIDLESGVVTRTMAVGEFPIRVKVRPGGAGLLVSNANGNELAEVDLQAWTVFRRLPVGAMPVGILITPDNRTAYVANTQDDKISVIDLDAWEVVGEIVTGDEPDGMAWVS